VNKLAVDVVTQTVVLGGDGRSGRGVGVLAESRAGCLHASAIIDFTAACSGSRQCAAPLVLDV